MPFKKGIRAATNSVCAQHKIPTLVRNRSIRRFPPERHRRVFASSFFQPCSDRPIGRKKRLEEIVMSDTPSLRYPGAYTREHGAKPAAIMAETGAAITYAELDAYANRLARFYHSLGLAGGEHVA